jgi:hypothetical protein
MTGLTPAAPTVALPRAPKHTAPEFGAFIVRKTSGAGGSPALVYGDANGDGGFGLADINQMVDWILSRTTPPVSGTAAFTRCDVNGDGLLGMQDLNLYVDRLLGRITKFTVEP